VVGAGNADDLPLELLARRAARVDLLDADARALRRAVRREAPALRGRLRPLRVDVTDGWADRIVRAVLAGRRPPEPPMRLQALGRGYDLVIGDLLYTQILFPALLDGRVPAARREAALSGAGAALTAAVVARLHAASGTGLAVHVHDVAGWWSGHEQPIDIERALALPVTELVDGAVLNQPTGCDPRAGLRRIGAEIVDTRCWRWPFAHGVDYLVCATVAVIRPGAGAPTVAPSRGRRAARR
jgi:hypothetical protein